MNIKLNADDKMYKNEKAEIFYCYESNKEDFVALLSKLMTSLNSVYKASFTINDLTEQEIFDLYSCYHSYLIKKKNILIKTKFTIKALYIPMFFSVLALTSSFFNFCSKKNIIEVLLVATLVFIVLFYRGILKDVKVISKNQDQDISVRLIENLKNIKYKKKGIKYD